MVTFLELDLVRVAAGLILGIVVSVHADNLPSCRPADFHYEYTECDSTGGRWRVSVPKPNTCVAGAPNPPVRGAGCDFTCEPGEYIDIQGDQQCHPCPNGSYSLGGGVRFDDWDDVPNGFAVHTEVLGSKVDRVHFGHINCSRMGWIPKGKYISSIAGYCAADLTYTANLVRAGKVKFTYQYTDDDSLLHFTVQNSKCQTHFAKEPNKWLSMTDENEWQTIEVDLTSGVNVLYWKTMGVESGRSKIRKPTLIKNIEITGVAFASECSRCRPGYYSGSGVSACTECPAGTYSSKGAATCEFCNNETEYSVPGSAECRTRPPCNEDDFYDYSSPCDINKKTRVVYKWIQPKVCREDLPHAVKLPNETKTEDCPPCNPGMEFKDGSCTVCPANQYSDGSDPCQPCPVSTAPETGLQYKWWNSLPKDANISTACLAVNNRGCAAKEGWIPALNNLHTGKGHTDEAYLVLQLDVGGFRGQEQVIHGSPQPVAQISFVFEVSCSSSCTFIFMQQVGKKATSVIETWKGSQPNQKYKFDILSTKSVVFTWAFQKENWLDKVAGPVSYLLKDDHAKMYSINVTNTLQGGASSCRSCPTGASQDGCIPCPPGSYVSINTTQCRRCPKHTVVQGQTPLGIESCVPCGEGLTTTDNVRCQTDGTYTSPAKRNYDFTFISSFQEVKGTSLFTSTGTEYYHVFNISLLASSDSDSAAACRENITSFSEMEGDNIIKAAICRMTMIPPRPGEAGGVMAAQPVSIGDILVNITSNGSSLNMEERMATEGFSVEESELDVHLVYISDVPTAACGRGRTTIVTMRCDVTAKGNGTITLPPNCPDGTCDGCSFHLLWSTVTACPTCKMEDYTKFKGECLWGKQEINYIPPKHCVTAGPITQMTTCVILPFWVQISIGLVAGLGIIMCFLLIYCWKRNQKLEYKYMKLVASSGSGEDQELPGVDSCALEEGDEEDHFDQVQFKEAKGKKFFSKLKLSKRKGSGHNPFEDIQLSEKLPLT